MRAQKINLFAGRGITLLSFIALLAVLSGYFQRPQADEGSSAHIFQLSIALLFLTALAFIASMDWKQPGKSARPLVLPAAALASAFAALFYLEHFWYR